MRYKWFRVPEDVFNAWWIKKKRIEERTNIKVPMTNVLRFYGTRKFYIFDDEIITFLKNTNKKRKFKGDSI